MELKHFIKLQLQNFILTQALITITIGVIGCVFAWNSNIPYYSFFAPFLYAFFATIPSFVLYSRQELSIRSMMFRNILHFILIEMIMLTLVWYFSRTSEVIIYICVAFSVLLIDVSISLISYLTDKKTADKMITQIRKYRELNSQREN